MGLRTLAKLTLIDGGTLSRLENGWRPVEATR
jgi:hypothetical protein